VPLGAPSQRSRRHASIVPDRRTVFYITKNAVRIDQNSDLR
jgi:hypothetical protein